MRFGTVTNKAAMNVVRRQVVWQKMECELMALAGVDGGKKILEECVSVSRRTTMSASSLGSFAKAHLCQGMPPETVIGRLQQFGAN